MKFDPASTIKGFRKLNVCVIGDVMLDRFIFGDVSRISPEAPVPVVVEQRTVETAGAAGNVAVNLATLGATAALVSITGDDQENSMLRRFLSANRVKAQGLFSSEKRLTILKTRVIARSQQVVRIDREKISSPSPDEQKKIIGYLGDNLESFDAFIFSDYCKGLLDERFAKKLTSLLSGKKLLALDTKKNIVDCYRGVDIITPNRKEAYAISSRNKDEKAAADVGKRLKCSVLMTLGRDGMLLYRKGRIHRLPSSAREVFDVSGAGDTVIAALALGLASGLGYPDSAFLANTAAGIAVGKLGTASVTPEELIAVLDGYQK